MTVVLRKSKLKERNFVKAVREKEEAKSTSVKNVMAKE